MHPFIHYRCELTDYTNNGIKLIKSNDKIIYTYIIVCLMDTFISELHKCENRNATSGDR